ncbi:MAG: imidazole glycerol phosphate synthase subunit HisH [Planctomycetota bacterium]|nr:MAG: imidazole glycerol phosphate synthase subunit HisH [Planctomycetota bacterium]
MTQSETPWVGLIRTGAANLASVIAALERLKLRWTFIQDSQQVLEAPFLILPGVGAFAPARQRLQEEGLDMALVERFLADKPMLAICLGMQLLSEGSEEAPGVPGLGIFPGTCRSLGSAEPLPNMGWKKVHPAAEEGKFLPRKPGWAYFAHSFALLQAPEDWNAALSEHGETPFVAAVQRRQVLACQFHPELSGGYGEACLKAWFRIGAGSAAESKPLEGEAEA